MIFTEDGFYDMDTLYSGDHIDVITPSGFEYESVHESDGVLMLPLLDGEYIIRKEVCPPYMVKDKENHDRFWTVVSGTVEPGEHVLKTLRREMSEETQVKPNRVRMIERKDHIPFTKLTTQRVTFCFFEILDYDETNAPGDGSRIEELSGSVRVTADELFEISNKSNADFTIQYASKCAKLESV